MTAPAIRRFIFAALILLLPAAAHGEVTGVSALQARKLIETGGVDLVLDVRTPGEYADPGHLAGAKLLPVQELADRVEELAPYRDKTILVYCRSGARSRRAAVALEHYGFTRVLDLLGGINAWQGERMPISSDR